MANFGNLFSAYGDTATNFFEGLSKADQAYSDTATRNLQMWLRQNEDKRQEQELLLRAKELGLRTEQQQFDLDKAKRQQAAEEEAYTPENIQKLEPFRKEEVSGERSHLGPVEYPTAPPTTSNPLANKYLMDAWTKRWGGSEKVEQAAVQRQMRKELSEVDFTDPEKAQAEIRRIYMKYVDDPEKALNSLKLTPREQQIKDRQERFQAALPVYTARLQAYKQNPLTRQWAGEYEAALQSQDPEIITKTEMDISKRMERKEAIDNAKRYHDEANAIRRETNKQAAADRQARLEEAKAAHDVTAISKVRDGFNMELREREQLRNRLMTDISKAVARGDDMSSPESLEMIAEAKSVERDIFDIKQKIKDSGHAINQRIFGGPPETGKQNPPVVPPGVVVRPRVKP